MSRSRGDRCPIFLPTAATNGVTRLRANHRCDPPQREGSKVSEVVEGAAVVAAAVTAAQVVADETRAALAELRTQRASLQATAARIESDCRDLRSRVAALTGSPRSTRPELTLLAGGAPPSTGESVGVRAARP